MITGVWGRKIGMTQVFVENRVVPVTVVDVDHWYVTAVRTQANDGYDAIQVGCLRKKYKQQPFVMSWLKKPSNHFEHIKEIKLSAPSTYKLGQQLVMNDTFAYGQLVDVVGWSKGCGFAGVYKRHGFGGAAKSHGSMMGRKPGSIGGLRTSGRVIKGKRMAGHLGNERVMIRKLPVISVNANEKALVIKGSVPGKAGSLVFIRKV